MTSDLSYFISQFDKARILCLGDVMLDRFVYGAVNRVSEEAPIPILKENETRAMLGGAGNVAANLISLGGSVSFISVIGSDDAGRDICDRATAQSGLTPHLVTDTNRQTTTKTRFVAAGQQLLRSDAECTDPVDADIANQLIERMAHCIDDSDVVILSDYAKGVFSDTVLTAAIDLARRHGKPVIADPKRSSFKDYAGVTILKPNRKELANATDGNIAIDDPDIEAAGARILEQVDITALLVSRSERGMSLLQKDQAALHLTAEAREVFDVSGAGDTVIAALAMAIASGSPLAAAARIANSAGALAVRKAGTAVVTQGELLQAFTDRRQAAFQHKIMDRPAATERRDRWRQAGLKVGFTNGCFDLLHPGHLTLLQDAAEQCDRLIVAINDDASVRQLKGPGRPALDEAARAKVLAALEMVDLVTVFSEDTPIPLLEQLQPDLLIKGGDYEIDGVVGADVVRAYGGDVKVSRQDPGRSTSTIIAGLDNSNDDS